MSPQIILASVILLIGFAGGWTVQDWRFSAKDSDRAQQELATVKQSAAANVRRLEAASEAEAKAVVRERGLRSDANALRSSIDSLSSHTATALRAAGASQAACLDTASALRDVFDASVAEYGALAEKADRHASDVQTLTESYPK